MATILVASDRGGAGKTAICAGLAAEMRRRGRSASTPDAIDAAAGARPAADGGDVAVVEVSSALSEAETARAAEALDASVVLVCGGGPGADASALGPWRDALGGRLLGAVVNGLTRYMGHDARTRLAPEMRSEGVAALGVIPEDRSLLAVTVGDIASHLGGRFILYEEEDGALVEHIMVGGLGLDSGTLYFGLRENKAVVIRGDRPDIQMAALATPMACMVLTMGIEPIEYVLNEADLEEAPLIVVEPGTLETMDALATVQDGARFDHPAKVERMAELVRLHVDVEAIERGAGLGNGAAPATV